MVYGRQEEVERKECKKSSSNSSGRGEKGGEGGSRRNIWKNVARVTRVSKRPMAKKKWKVKVCCWPDRKLNMERSVSSLLGGFFLCDFLWL